MHSKSIHIAINLYVGILASVICLFIFLGVFIYEKVQPSVGGGASMSKAMSATSSDIQTAEETYKTKNGKYLQVLPNNTTVNGVLTKTALGADVATGITIHEYTSPDGKPGYIKMWSDKKGRYSIGYGSNAEQYTWTYLYPTSTATTTK